jgi:Zn-dependent peptidase ImmA (M78 family)
MSGRIIRLSGYPSAGRVIRSINPARERFIRNEARQLLVRAWNAERKLRKIQVADILPIEPRWVAQLFPDWRFLFVEPAEIGTSAASGRPIAGVLDRVSRTTEVASNLPLTVRRFTGAHELGHLVLHPEVQSLRESPIGDRGMLGRGTPPKEQEANLFAAELLIPTRLLRELFARRFPPTIYRDSIDDDTAYYCSNGELRASDFRAMNLLELAQFIAKAGSFTTADSRPLTEVFGVSATAMAIQLIDLGLVRINQFA